MADVQVFHLALAFSGGLGLFNRKLRDAGTEQSSPSDGLFNVSAECWRRTLLPSAAAAPSSSARVLTFLHTWRLPPHVAARMVATLRPVAFEFEAPLPEATTCDANSSCPVQQYAFTSLWHSRLAVLRLVRRHETRALRRRFDAVLLARFDLCPCQAAHGLDGF